MSPINGIAGTFWNRRANNNERIRICMFVNLEKYLCRINEIAATHSDDSNNSLTNQNGRSSNS